MAKTRVSATMREPGSFRDLTLFFIACMNLATAILADRQTCISFSVQRRETPRRFLSWTTSARAGKRNLHSTAGRIPCCVFQSASSKFRFIFNLSRLRGGDPGGENGLGRATEEKNKATKENLPADGRNASAVSSQGHARTPMIKCVRELANGQDPVAAPSTPQLRPPQQYRRSEGGRNVQQDMPQSPYCESEDHTGRRAHAPIHREGGMGMRHTAWSSAAASFEARSGERGSKDAPISQSERREMLLRQGWERSSNLREGFRAREIEDGSARARLPSSVRQEGGGLPPPWGVGVTWGGTGRRDEAWNVGGGRVIESSRERGWVEGGTRRDFETGDISGRDLRKRDEDRARGAEIHRESEREVYRESEREVHRRRESAEYRGRLESTAMRDEDRAREGEIRRESDREVYRESEREVHRRRESAEYRGRLEHTEMRDDDRAREGGMHREREREREREVHSRRESAGYRGRLEHVEMRPRDAAYGRYSVYLLY